MLGTLYWEPGGTSGTNASGTWTTATSTQNWTTDSAGVSTGTSGYAAGSDVVFSADPSATGASFITLAGGALTANSMTFGNGGAIGVTGSSNGATGGYTFANGENVNLGNGAAGNTFITMNSGVGAATFQGAVFPGSANNQTYTIINNSASLLTFGGQFGGSGNNYTVAITGTGSGGVTFNGSIEGNSGDSLNGGTVSLNVSGGGGITLNGTNWNAGELLLAPGGSATLGNPLAMQTMALNITGGALSFGTLTSARIAGIEGTGSFALTNSVGAAVNVIFSGASSDKRQWRFSRRSNRWRLQLFRRHRRFGRPYHQQHYQ